VGEPGLDDDKLSLLAKWASGLRGDQRPEVAAAGRAIEMLIDEVERLNVLIWDGRLRLSELRDQRELSSTPPDMDFSLRARLRRRVESAVHFGGEPEPESPRSAGPSEEHRSGSRSLDAS
jgi:hypothetical protein